MKKVHRRPLPPVERLRELFDYDPETGHLLNRRRAGDDRFSRGFNSRYAGKPAGGKHQFGFLCVRVGDGRTCYAHRVIWKMMTGNEPGWIDHINADRADNRWCNLRVRVLSRDVLSIAERPPAKEQHRRSIPSVERLRELFDYDAATGDLFWRHRIVNDGYVRRFSRRWAGTRLDTRCGQGYIVVSLDGGQLKAHRIIWKMMTGEDVLMVDHINRDRADNRWCNLRAADHSINAANQSVHSMNKFGVRGVYRDQGRYYARLSVRRKLLHLGAFDSIEEASAAQQAAFAKHWPNLVVQAKDMSVFKRSIEAKPGRLQSRQLSFDF